jgi:hypothetical protein
VLAGLERASDRRRFVIIMSTRHISRDHRRLGRTTLAGLILILCLFLLLAIKANWPWLQTDEGRHEVAGEVTTTLRSQDTFIAAFVVVVNVWLYAALTKRLYPTGADVRRGLRDAAMLMAGTDMDPGDTRDTAAELKHFFLIIILPFVFIAGAIGEYHVIKRLCQHRAIMGDTGETQLSESTSPVKAAPGASSAAR